MPDTPPQITDVAGQAIRRYDDLRLEVAAIAQAAMLQCAKAKNEEGERAFQHLLGLLAEDRFNLAVVGPFSRGKSSLMNAILGFEHLPTGLLPHTSVITTVTYGPRERILVRCEGWSEAALARFVAIDKTGQLMVRVTDRLVACLQRESLRAGFGLAASRSPQQISKTLRNLDEAVAGLKARRLELASRLEAAGNDTLRAVKPRIDIAFTNVKQSALKKFLPEFLAGETLSEPVAFEEFTRRLSGFCEQALTRELQLYEAALNEHCTWTGGRLLKQIGELPDELFTNAINPDGGGCEGLTPDGQMPETAAPHLVIGGVPPVNWNPRLPWWLYLRPSGFFSGKVKREFGAVVDQLLTQYRSSVEDVIRRTMTDYLDRMNRETERVIDDRAAGMKRALVQAGTSRSYETFDQLLGQARRLRSRFDDKGRAPTRVAESAPGRVDSKVAIPLLPITRVRACPICRRVVEAVFDYLSKLQYELSTEATAQNENAQAGGFCSAHTWIYSSLTSPVAISRAYPALLDSHAARLRLAAYGANSVDGLAREIRDACASWRNCSVCAVASQAADKAVEDLLTTLDVGGRIDMPTLCLPHLDLVLQRTDDLEGSRLLAIRCADDLSHVADDMRRHGLKHDAIRRDLMTADERDAPQMGLRKLVGDMRLVSPPHEDRRL